MKVTSNNRPETLEFVPAYSDYIMVRFVENIEEFLEGDDKFYRFDEYDWIIKNDIKMIRKIRTNPNLYLNKVKNGEVD